MRILDYNHCKQKTCDCGFNISIGGSSQELRELKNFLAGKIEEDLTNYVEKINTEEFTEKN